MKYIFSNRIRMSTYIIQIFFNTILPDSLLKTSDKKCKFVFLFFDNELCEDRKRKMKKVDWIN